VSSSQAIGLIILPPIRNTRSKGSLPFILLLSTGFCEKTGVQHDLTQCLQRDSLLFVVLQCTHRPQHVAHVTLALLWRPLVVVPPAPFCLRRPRLSSRGGTRLTAVRLLCLQPIFITTQ